jgi:hypothetical protein
MRLLLFLMLALSCSAADFTNATVGTYVSIGDTFSIGGGGGGGTYLLEEGFEGTGYENTWTEGGTASPNEDYATSPAPLVGSQSLFLDSGTSSFTGHTLASTHSELWLFGRILLPVTAALANGRQLFSIRDADDTTDLASVAMGSVSGSTFGFRVYNGATVATSSTTTRTTNTEYYVWFQYVKGTGSDGVSRLYVGTDYTRPAVDVQITNGAATNDAQVVRCTVGSGTDCIYDDIKVSASEIADNP